MNAIQQNSELQEAVHFATAAICEGDSQCQNQEFAADQKSLVAAISTFENEGGLIPKEVDL